MSEKKQYFTLLVCSLSSKHKQKFSINPKCIQKWRERSEKSKLKTV